MASANSKVDQEKRCKDAKKAKQNTKAEKRERHIGIGET